MYDTSYTFGTHHNIHYTFPSHLTVIVNTHKRPSAAASFHLVELTSAGLKLVCPWHNRRSAKNQDTLQSSLQFNHKTLSGQLSEKIQTQRDFGGRVWSIKVTVTASNWIPYVEHQMRNKLPSNLFSTGTPITANHQFLHYRVSHHIMIEGIFEKKTSNEVLPEFVVVQLWLSVSDIWQNLITIIISSVA